MAITLTEDEERALATALDNYLPELRYELSRVKLESQRHGLVQLEEKLSSMRKRLK